MKRLCAFCVALGALSLCTSSLAGPEKKMAPFKSEVGPKATWTIAVTFKGGERANVNLVGDGKSHLGLYILDSKGNCVAWDDDADSKFLDDRWVIWYPPKTQTYTIEVRNLGGSTNVFEMVIR